MPPTNGSAAVQRRGLRRQCLADGGAFTLAGRRINLTHSTQQIAFQEYLHASTQAGERIARLVQALNTRRVDKTTAVVRELAGFAWAIGAREVQLSGWAGPKP